VQEFRETLRHGHRPAGAHELPADADMRSSVSMTLLGEQVQVFDKLGKSIGLLLELLNRLQNLAVSCYWDLV